MAHMRVIGVGAACALVAVACGKTQRGETPSNEPASATVGSGGTTTVGTSSGGVATGSGGSGFGGTAGAESVFPCERGATRVGDVRLETQDAVVDLAGVSEVDGALHISGQASDLRPLHCLRRVTGGLFIYETQGTKHLAGLEGLSTAEAGLYVGVNCDEGQLGCTGNRDLQSVVLPQLEHASRVEIGTSCGGEGGPYCGPNAALGLVELNRLVDVDDISLSSNPVLVDAHFDAVDDLSSLSVSSNDQMRTLPMRG